MLENLKWPYVVKSVEVLRHTEMPGGFNSFVLIERVKTTNRERGITEKVTALVDSHEGAIEAWVFWKPRRGCEREEPDPFDAKEHWKLSATNEPVPLELEKHIVPKYSPEHHNGYKELVDVRDVNGRMMLQCVGCGKIVRGTRRCHITNEQSYSFSDKYSNPDCLCAWSGSSVIAVGARRTAGGHL